MATGASVESLFGGRAMSSDAVIASSVNVQAAGRMEHLSASLSLPLMLAIAAVALLMLREFGD